MGATGTQLANRYKDDDSANLCYCAGYDRGQAVVLRSFSDSEALTDYSHGIKLLF